MKDTLVKDLEIAKELEEHPDERFVLMVAFDTSEELTDPEKDMCFVDPLNEYKRYYCKFAGKLVDTYLFNGQIVYVTGSLSPGGVITVTDLVTGFTEYSYELQQDKVNKYYGKDLSPFKMTVMAGPYMSRNSADLGVFKRIISNIKEKDTHLLVLQGPFIDINNNLVKTGKLNMSKEVTSYEGLFFLMLTILDDLLKDTRISIIIVPSVDDVNNVWPIPQPKFYSSHEKITKLEIFKNRQLFLANNPHFFEFNGMGISIANFDYVKDFGDLAVCDSSANKIDKALLSMIEQRSYYPLIPQNLNKDEDNEEERLTYVDYRKMKHLAIQVIPDILIMPSRVEPFAKNVGSVLFVNPGKLFYKNELGSLAEISVYPAKVNF